MRQLVIVDIIKCWIKSKKLFSTEAKVAFYKYSESRGKFEKKGEYYFFIFLYPRLLNYEEPGLLRGCLSIIFIPYKIFLFLNIQISFGCYQYQIV